VEHVIAWAGFLGAWLLVAGPVFQAAIELQEEELDHEAVDDLQDDVPRPAPVSGWWWLLPPVAFVLQRRRSAAYREAVMNALPATLRAQFVHFSDKAAGWLLVAGGAFFIAVKETWELHEVEEWPVAVFWALLPVMLVLAVAYTVLRVRRTHDLLARGDDRGGGAAGGAADGTPS
jgi:hypothetical protein